MSYRAPQPFGPQHFGPPPFGPQYFGPPPFGHPFGPQHFGQPPQQRTVGNEQDRNAHFADLHERYRLEKEYIGRRVQDHDNGTERFSSDKKYENAIARWEELTYDLMPAAQRQEFRPADHPIGVGPERMIERFGPLTVQNPHPAYGMPPISTADIDPREFKQESVLVFQQDGHVHRVPARMGDGTPVMRKVMPKTLSMTLYFPEPVANSNAVRLVP